MGMYLKLVALVVLLVSVFGFAAPYLISADATELVLAGFALIFLVTLPLTYFLIKGIGKDGKTLIRSLSVKEEKEDVS